jgi:hypothetical protein
MKINLQIESDASTIAKAIFDTYVDIKKKELTKRLEFDKLTEVDCKCSTKTVYKISEKK